MNKLQILKFQQCLSKYTFFSFAQNLNENLNKINHWGFQWKMSFNPDPSKQAQEVIFSRKLQKSVYSPLHFHHIAVTQLATQNHLGMLLDVKLDFQGHLKSIYM